jgi:hypothetical protein
MMVQSSLSGSEETPWGIEDLIAVAEKVMASDPELFAHPESDTNKELNVRLIRDYVVREFIPRPERSGRESRFGLDHLVYLLAIRALLRSQKWSLPAIKASFSTTSREGLLASTLQPVRQRIEAEYEKAKKVGNKRSPSSADQVVTPDLNPAQLLIQRFKAARAQKGSDSVLANKQMAPMELFSLLSSNAAPQAPATVSRKVHIELEPGCEVVIDAQRMNSLTGEEIERLGQAIKSRLKDETAR